MSKADRARERQRENARNTAKAKILMDYVQRGGAPPEFQRHYKLPYGGKSRWWLEPLLKQGNFVLLESELQDGWYLEVQPLDPRLT